MIREINLYEILNNGGLGKSHLIDKKKGGCNGFIYSIVKKVAIILSYVKALQIHISITQIILAN